MHRECRLHMQQSHYATGSVYNGSHPPVWPDENSKVKGIAFRPLYPSVPDAARIDLCTCMSC